MRSSGVAGRVVPSEEDFERHTWEFDLSGPNHSRHSNGKQMALDPTGASLSLEQVRAKQREFIEVLERQVERGGHTAVDLFAIANEVDIVPVLAVEFLYYWIGIGRLHKSWKEIAEKMQAELTKDALKPPVTMISTEGVPEKRIKKSPDQDQRRVYDELWQDILAIQETRNTSQMPFANREEGAQFHRSQTQPGFDGIAKVDRLSPYLDHEHYEVIRNYFNVFCNYHAYRLEKYADENLRDPSGWDEQDALLYGQIFGKGQLEIAQVFREVLARQDVEEASELTIGSFHMGDTFSFSGDFRGSNVNVKSTLQSVTQTISTLPNTDDESKRQLAALMVQLNEVLQQHVEQQPEDTEAVLESAKDLIEKVNKEKPNKKLIELSAKGFKEAAEAIADVVPIALSIVKTVAAFAGVPVAP